MLPRVTGFRHHIKAGALLSNILELLDRQTAVDRNVRPGSGGALQVTTQDRGSLAEIHSCR